jgi:hypothetical protein
MTSLATAVCDSGPLVAASDQGDPDHRRCLAVLQRADLRIVIPTLAVAEVCHFLAARPGARVEAAFLRGLSRYEVESPLPEEWARVAQLVEQYADFPLGGTDASIVSLAERLRTDLLITLDARHFRAIKPNHVEAFRLLPE